MSRKQLLQQAKARITAREERQQQVDLRARRHYNRVHRGGTYTRIARLTTNGEMFDANGLFVDRIRLVRTMKKGVLDLVTSSVHGRVALKRGVSDEEAKAMEYMYTALRLQHNCARTLRPIALIDEVEGDTRGRAVLMQYLAPCSHASDDQAAVPSCQLTFYDSIRDGFGGGVGFAQRLHDNEAALVGALLRVVRALELLNEGENVFVHGDLHSANVLVRVPTRMAKGQESEMLLKGARTKRPLIEHVYLIDPGFAYAQGGEGAILNTGAINWKRRCDGKLPLPHPCRDLMTLFLSILEVVPLRFENLHRELFRPLVGYLNSHMTRENADKLNQCGGEILFKRFRDPARAPQPWEKGDFVYSTDSDVAVVRDREGHALREPYFALYANTVPPPPIGNAANAFRSPSAMRAKLEEILKEVGAPSAPKCSFNADAGRCRRAGDGQAADSRCAYNATTKRCRRAGDGEAVDPPKQQKEARSWSSNYETKVPYIQTTNSDALEIKFTENKTAWASNLADAPPGSASMLVTVEGAPAFRNGEALYQWQKARFFDARLHQVDKYSNAMPEAEGRRILQSTITEDLTGVQAKKAGGKGSFKTAIANALKPLKVKEKAARLYDEIMPEWKRASFGFMADVVSAKFSRKNPMLVKLLLETGTRAIYEGRRRSGSVWEVAAQSDFESAQNPQKWGFLGTILMRRRDELRQSPQPGRNLPQPQPQLRQPKRKRARVYR